MFSPLRAPHWELCILGCDLLFELGSFLFSSLVPLSVVFPLFIYLFKPLKYEKQKTVSFEGMKVGTAEQNISGMWTRLKTWFWDLS